MSLQTTEFIVLRKTPYGESSMVVAGFSEGCGRLAFLVRGARRLGRRDFPLVDLFRCLHVTFHHSERSSLNRWSSADRVHDFGPLAQHSARYLGASTLARFLLRETAECAPLPRTYAALKTGLRRLATADANAANDVLLPAVRIGILLTFLKENGELDQSSFAPDDCDRFHQLLEMAAGETVPPRLTAATWTRLDNWVQYLLDAADYRFEALLY